MERRRTNPKPLPEVLSTFDADEDLEPFPADFIGPKDNALLRMRKENNDKKRAYEMMAPNFLSATEPSATGPSVSWPYHICFAADYRGNQPYPFTCFMCAIPPSLCATTPSATWYAHLVEHITTTNPVHNTYPKL